MDETVQVLATKIDSLRESLEDLKDRASEDRTVGDRRHEDNVSWLRRIDANQQITNGKVITLEASMKEVFRRLRERVERAALVSGVTLKDVGLWVSIVGGTYVLLVQVLGFHR